MILVLRTLATAARGVRALFACRRRCRAIPRRRRCSRCSCCEEDSSFVLLLCNPAFLLSNNLAHQCLVAATRGRIL